MRTNRYRLYLRGFLRYGVSSTFFLCLFFSLGYAQEAEIAKYPSRPITFIVPTPAGSTADIPCRVLVKEAEKFLGQPIVVVNKPGASQAIGIAAIATAKPDGYTIGYAGHPGIFFAPLMEKVPYHPVKDLKPIVQFGYLNIAVTVKGDSPFKSFKDLVDFARKNPKKMAYGSSGTGTVGNVLMEQIARREGVQFTHIPFKGSSESQVALLGGHILAGTGGFTPPLIESGQIRLLLLIAEKRSTEYPEVPIMKDLGYDIPAPLISIVIGPKGLPDEIVKRLEGALTKAMNEPAFLKVMKDILQTVVYRSSSELDDYVARNYETFAKIIKEMGLAAK